MKKKVIILGSTGSIGKTTFKIIKKSKKNFSVELISTNKNAKLLLNQAKILNVKKAVIFDEKKFIENKKIYKKNKIKLYNNFSSAIKLIKKKVDITICGISGIYGLQHLLKSIEISKKVGVANKESIICGWNLIKKSLYKNQTKFIPLDSEHFSLWRLIRNKKINDIKEVFLTASGGPFLNKKKSDLKNIDPKFALRHPNWKMGKKISIDSATMMNKVFEVIEAHKLFNIDFKKIKILIHPTSYIHSIVKLKDGTIHLLAHDTKMEIPIANSLFENNIYNYNDNKFNININNMKFYKPNKKQFPSLKFLDQFSNRNKYYEILLIVGNEELVNYYLKNKIKYEDIYYLLSKLIKMNLFKNYDNNGHISLKKINKIIKIVKSNIRNIIKNKKIK